MTASETPKDTRTWEERARAAEAGCAELRAILGKEKRGACVITVVAKRRGWTIRVHTTHPDGSFDIEEEKAVSLATMRVILESASSLVHVALMAQNSENFAKATAAAGEALFKRVMGESK